MRDEALQDHFAALGRSNKRVRIRKGRSMTDTTEVQPKLLDGTVCWYDETRRMGFISRNDVVGADDVFVHQTALRDAHMSPLVAGQKVRFSIISDKKTGKPKVGIIEPAI